MGKSFPRASDGKTDRMTFGEFKVDVFEQPERSLIGEALSKPFGFFGALTIVTSAGAFIANSFFLDIERINEFALVGLLVGGGILLSILLRGDNSAPKRKRPSPKRSAENPGDLILEEVVFEEGADDMLFGGFAEARPPAAPIPPQVLAADRGLAEPAEASDKHAFEAASFEQALVHYVNAGDLHGQGEVLRRLGHLAKRSGNLKESREFYMKSRNCFRQISDHYAEAAVLLDLGQILESLEENDAASAAYRDANRALLDVAMNSSERYDPFQAQAAD